MQSEGTLGDGPGPESRRGVRPGAELESGHGVRPTAAAAKYGDLVVAEVVWPQARTREQIQRRLPVHEVVVVREGELGQGALVGTRRRTRSSAAAMALGASCRSSAGSCRPGQWTEKWERTGGGVATKVTSMGQPVLVLDPAVEAFLRAALYARTSSRTLPGTCSWPSSPSRHLRLLGELAARGMAFR